MIELPAEIENTRDLLIHTLYSYDESRGRSLQVLPGASELGGCRRRTFYRMNEYPEVNYTSKIAAIKGTAFHAHIEKAFEWLDPAGERFKVEVTVPGIEGMGDGHVDLVDLERKRATDWKTTQKKSLRYFPKQGQRWQVQVYGDLLVRAGYDIIDVELVAIPLDGDENDIRIHTEPRNPAMAEEAYQWLRDLNTMQADGEFPPADLNGVICERYCPYFGPTTCSGKTLH